MVAGIFDIDRDARHFLDDSPNTKQLLPVLRKPKHIKIPERRQNNKNEVMSGLRSPRAQEGTRKHRSTTTLPLALPCAVIVINAT